MGSAKAAARAGRLACLFQRLSAARALLRKILPDAQEVIFKAIDLTGTETELESLKAEGLEVTVHATIAGGAEPRINLRENFEPARDVMGVVARALAEKELASIVNRATTDGSEELIRRGAARIQSFGGGAGYWVEPIPSRRALHLNDVEFVTGARHRLGLPQIPTGTAKCQLRASAFMGSADQADLEATQCAVSASTHISTTQCVATGAAASTDFTGMSREG